MKTALSRRTPKESVELRLGALRELGQCFPGTGTGAPDYWLHGSHEENPYSSACPRDGGHDDEGPEKLAGALKHKTGYRGRDYAREISDEALESCPTSRGLGPGKCLRDGPNI